MFFQNTTICTKKVKVYKLKLSPVPVPFGNAKSVASVLKIIVKTKKKFNRWSETLKTNKYMKGILTLKTNKYMKGILI